MAGNCGAFLISVTVGETNIFTMSQEAELIWEWRTCTVKCNKLHLHLERTYSVLKQNRLLPKFQREKIR